MTTTEEMVAMDARLVSESLTELRIEARLREWCGDAIERAPGLAAWISGRLALLR